MNEPVHRPAEPLWRRQPYRLFFPLGLLLAWAGVGHWLLHGLGFLEDYRPVFHAIAQIQGFMICFALGFLYTAVPRRTGTPPPNLLELAVAIIAPVGITVSAWYQRLALSQLFWLLLVATVLVFLIRRFVSRGAGRRPPASFVWVPIAFLMGMGGSLLIGAYGILGEEHYGLHELGRLLLLQGMFLGLILGLGPMVFPLLTRGESSKDLELGPRGFAILAGHLLAACILAASFWIETEVSLRWGFGLRGGLVGVLLVVSAGLLRRPSLPGWHRHLVWLAAWMIPLGYVLAGVFPMQKKAGLHVVFIGGFALLTLSVGLHVLLAHGGHERLVRGRPWQVPAFAGLLLVSLVSRWMVDLRPEWFQQWLAISASTFLLATVVWASLALPRLWNAAGSGSAP